MITLDEVKAKAAEIVAENPDAINPVAASGRSCAYTKRRDDSTPNTADHCIGGTLLLAFDAALPSEGKTVSASPDADRFTEDGLRYIRALQLAADGFNVVGTGVQVFGHDTIPLRTWSEAKRLVDESIDSIAAVIW